MVLTNTREVADIFDSMAAALVTQPQDHSADHRDAWIFGILCGWDDALGEVAAKHDWNAETVARLRRYHVIVEALSEEARS